MEEFPASKVHLQPTTWLTRSFPADVCPDITGQFWCGHRAKFTPQQWGGGGVSDQIKSPQHQIPSDRTLFLLHLPASKNGPEEQIFWGTDPLGAPEYSVAALYDASLGGQSSLIEVLRLTFQVLQQTCLVNHALVGDIERRLFINYNNLNSTEPLQINNLNNSW